MPSKKNVIKLYVADDEFAQIARQAQQAGLSLSTYGKRVCLGSPVASKLDAMAIRDLIKINADMGRVGGLLKLWLTDPEKRDGYTGSVRPLLNELLALKQILGQKIEQL